jgi:phosphoglycolate phosphatase
MAIRGVLFDKDGTLIESDGTWIAVFKAFLSQVKKAGPDEVDALMAKAGYDIQNNKLIPGSVLAAGISQESIGIWWPELDADGVAEKYRLLNNEFAHLAQDHMKPLMDLVPVLDALHAMGLKLGVATNDTFRSATGHMHQLGVHDYFVEIIGADSVAIAKPSGQMIKRFADVTGLQPYEIAMVGDNTHDMDEARAGGAGLAIGVLTGNAAREDIAHLADHILDSIADIPALLKRLS